MKNLWLKISNGLTAILLLVLGLWRYESLQDFAWIGAGLIVADLALNFSVLRSLAKTKADYIWLILPVLFIIGLWGTAAATSSQAVKIFVMVSSVLFFYSYQIHLPRRPSIFEEDFFSLLSGFLLLIFVWSLNFFFTPPAWSVTLLIFALFFAFFWQVFHKLRPFPRESTLWALICSLILIEISWGLLFWPVHFLTAAVVNFSVFYLLYMLGRLYFYSRLTKKKVYFQAALILVVLVFSLLSSSWRP